MVRIRFRGVGWTFLTACIVVSACVTPPGGDGTQAVVKDEHRLVALLRDAANEARSRNGLPPLDAGTRIVMCPADEWPRPLADLLAYELETTYVTRTALYAVVDDKPILQYWIAVAKDRSRYFILGDSATPEGLTAFLEYEGKVAPHAWFDERDAAAFMDFWAVCASQVDEMHVVGSFEHLRELLRLSIDNDVPEDADGRVEQIRSALKKIGINDIAPYQQEILPLELYKLEFYLLDLIELRVARVAVFYEMRGGGPLEITDLVMETVFGMRSALENFHFRPSGSDSRGSGEQPNEQPLSDPAHSPNGQNSLTRQP